MKWCSTLIGAMVGLEFNGFGLAWRVPRCKASRGRTSSIGLAVATPIVCEDGLDRVRVRFCGIALQLVDIVFPQPRSSSLAHDMLFLRKAGL